jgi:hypothetical protein
LPVILKRGFFHAFKLPFFKYVLPNETLSAIWFKNTLSAREIAAPNGLRERLKYQVSMKQCFSLSYEW